MFRSFFFLLEKFPDLVSELVLSITEGLSVYMYDVLCDFIPKSLLNSLELAQSEGFFCNQDQETEASLQIISDYRHVRCKSALCRHASIELSFNLALMDEPLIKVLWKIICPLFCGVWKSVKPNEWKYEPEKEWKDPDVFVGLKNLGSTCYINSLVQQLFMVSNIKNRIFDVHEVEQKPSTKENLLPHATSTFVFGAKRGHSAESVGNESNDERNDERNDVGVRTNVDHIEKSLKADDLKQDPANLQPELLISRSNSAKSASSKASFTNKSQGFPFSSKSPEEKDLIYHIQLMFSHLISSSRRCFAPRDFCLSFGDEEGFNFHMQHDVDEFFNRLCDQLDTKLKETTQVNVTIFSFLSHFSGLQYLLFSC